LIDEAGGMPGMPPAFCPNLCFKGKLFRSFLAIVSGLVIMLNKDHFGGKPVPAGFASPVAT